MTFHDPWILLLLPAAAIVLIKRRTPKAESGIIFSSFKLITGIKGNFRTRLRANIRFFRLFCVSLLILAAARPQSPVEDSRTQGQGIDIVLAIDVSGSMRAEDFTLGNRRVNRLEVVKDVVRDFVSQRPADRIAVVIFSQRPYIVCPLTLDHDWLIKGLDRVRIGMIEDGTAIGMGISTALNRLKDMPEKSKVIILLTDGRNNAGKISPLSAAEAAKALGVRVYTIGAGTKGMAPYPMKDIFGNTVYQPVRIDLDEDLLKEIAAKTEGEYFRATDTDSLRRVYQQIDRMEKAPITERGYREYNELFVFFLIPALLLLALEFILRNSWLMKVP